MDLYVGVEEAGSGEFDELAAHDVELPGCRVGVQDCGPGGVFGGCLEVVVEIWGFDCADPVVAALEGRAWVAG